jgi:alpha-ketoglutarate-dependent taurine dioxygenase
MDNATAPFVVRRMAGAIGAEIGGIELRPDLPDAVMAELRRWWLEHLVLFFRNQGLTPQELAAVARRFGEVVHYPFLKGLDEAPEVIRVAKLEHETVNFGGLWHTDTAYLAEPPMATMLIAREVPPHGGDTLFASLYAAYDALSDGMKQMLAPLRAVNSSSKAEKTRTREDRGANEPPRGAGGRASSRAHASRNRPQGPVRERRPHAALRRHDRGGERAVARVSVRASGPTRVHLSLPLGARLGRVLGQPLCASQPDQRLSRLPPHHAPRHAGRRSPAMSALVV